MDEFSSKTVSEISQKFANKPRFFDFIFEMISFLIVLEMFGSVFFYLYTTYFTVKMKIRHVNSRTLLSPDCFSSLISIRSKGDENI